MLLHHKTSFVKTPLAKLTLSLVLLGVLIGLSGVGFAQNRAAQNQTADQAAYQARPSVSYQGYRMLNDDLRCSAQGHYPGPPSGSPCYTVETNFTAINDAVRRESEPSSTYQDLVRRQRILAAHEAGASSSADGDGARWDEESVAQSQANPDAPDQSELLKSSKDRDFILHNFRTMYVDAHGAKYFGSDQMKAALGKNKEFWKLNVRIVDDPRVADVVLKVSYTFAWDFPFELTHRNTTIVLLAGKGEGPFSGPLGAADVARNFVNMAKPWRAEKEKPTTDKH